MPQNPRPLALVVGAGSGLSAALARLLATEGYAIALAARSIDKLAALCAATGAQAHACDAGNPAQVAALFAALDAGPGAPAVVVYNAGLRVRGEIASLDAAKVRECLETGAYGAFLVAQQAVQRMLRVGSGTLLLTGASASLKGFAGSAPFAMAKFALRGLAQSLARELGPRGIHVAHVVIDGGIRNPGRVEPPDRPDSMLDPEAIARSYLDLIRQPRSAWSAELELRPWTETF